MQLNRRLIVISFRVVIALAILAGGAFILNKWSPQPANSSPSAESPSDDPIDLPDTGLVQLTTPVTSISYYVRDIHTLYTLGFNLGDADWKAAGTQDHLVILDYGYPIFQGGAYGAQLLYDSGQKV
jgi:hypothetical protein